MMKLLLAFAAGLLFGLGLLVSGMADPAKVLQFLDLAGHWDPSLILVMAGAVAVASVAFGVARRRRSAWTGDRFAWPMATRIDRRLLIGAVMFGAGWGLAGYCPGPALVALGQGSVKALLFGGAMLVGMAVFHFWERWRQGRPPANADLSQ